MSGIKTQSEVVQGVGAIKACINYDTGEMVFTKPDGTVLVTDFRSAAAQLAQAIELMTPEQQTYVTNIARERGAHTKECQVALAAISAIHGGAWNLATTLLTGIPALGWLASAGGGALFAWFRTFC